MELQKQEIKMLEKQIDELKTIITKYSANKLELTDFLAYADKLVQKGRSFEEFTQNAIKLMDSISVLDENMLLTMPEIELSAFLSQLQKLKSIFENLNVHISIWFLGYFIKVEQIENTRCNNLCAKPQLKVKQSKLTDKSDKSIAIDE